MKKEVIILALILLSGCTPEGVMEIYFFDVGQGDSAFVITPENKTILIDCGKNNEAAEYLTKMNITKIDALIISHNDIDHSGGCKYVFNKINVGKIYTNKNVKKDTKLKISKIAKIELIVAYDTKYMKSSNDNSVLAKIKFGKTSFLFTGDCEQKCENELIKTENLDIDVLKAGHHGSKSSTSNEFLKKTTPDIAIISSGKNSYGHPHKETIERLANSEIAIYRTDISGTIKVKTDGNMITIEENKKYK